MVYDEQWLKDFIIQDMNEWERVDIVRFYDNYSLEGAIALYRKQSKHGAFYVEDHHTHEEFATDFIEEAPIPVTIESDSVKEELLTSIEMMLL